MASPYSQLFNPENIFTSNDGGGAGNNWAFGYGEGHRVRDDLVDMFDREAEGSDHLEVNQSFISIFLFLETFSLIEIYEYHT